MERKTLNAPTPTTIAIVGGGFSGTLVATHLLKTATQPLTIKLIERQEQIGRGIAYSTATTCHLLNVSAGNMSAFPKDGGHFLRWLYHNYRELAPFLPLEISASTFIPRKVYGLYIQSILEEAQATATADVKLERTIAEVVAVEKSPPPEPNSPEIKLSLSNHQTITANKVVLALGNSPTAPPPAQPLDYTRNAWSADALANLDRDASILLIGTGLTMVDMALSLQERQHRGKIYAISRRGLSPQRHQATKPYGAFLTPDTAPKTALGLWRRLRSEIKTAAALDYNWRSIVDSLRPITQRLWQQLPQKEQQRFLRHATPYWDVHRHRIASQVAEVVDQLLNSGQLTIAAGRIQCYHQTSQGVEVTIHTISPSA